MDSTLRYIDGLPNFDSAYNILPKPVPQSTMYIPFSSSTIFTSYSNRPTSPLFHRCISPPPRQPLTTGTGPKFNFDLYKMNENYDEYTGYSSPTHRSQSPTSPRVIYHYPIHSPTSSPTLETGTSSKLRQINDELCRTLARSEFIDQPSSVPPHHHIHHYPLSQHSYSNSLSRRKSEERPPPAELEVPPRIQKARVTYKIHIPRRYHQRISSRHRSTSDEYSSDEPITIDLYPTRDPDLPKQTKHHSDDRSPWLVDGKSIRRDSYSDARTSRTPKGPYYGDEPISSYRQSNHDKEHPSSSIRRQSPYINSRIRPDSAPSDASFSGNTPSPSKRTSKKPPRYFESVLKPDRDETQSETMSQRRTLSDRTKIRTSDPKMKKRVENAESKIKSTWEPTVTGLPKPTVKESKPPVPIPTKKTTTDTPRKPKVKSVPSEPTTPTKQIVSGPPATLDTGRSSLNDVPTKPTYESTPRNQNNTQENNDSVEDLFENEPHTPEPSKKEELPDSPPPVEKKPIPQKPSPELPKTIVPEPDKGTKSTAKIVPSPRSEVGQSDDEAADSQVAQPKANDDDSESVVDPPDADRDENDEEVARSFDINKWLSDASKAILGPAKKDNLDIASNPPPQPPVKSKPKSPPRRKEQPRSPSPDENLYKPPFGPKKIVPKPSTSPPPPATTTTGETDEVDDFFS